MAYRLRHAFTINNQQTGDNTMDKETKDKLIKLRALLETKVQIADSEKNDYSVVRIVGYGLDNIFKILNIETPLDDRFGNLNSKLKNQLILK